MNKKPSEYRIHIGLYYCHDLKIKGLSHFTDGVAGSNPAGSEILPEPKRRFIAQSLSCSPFHRLDMTEILLKGRKTLTHPSIHFTDFQLITFLTILLLNCGDVETNPGPASEYSTASVSSTNSLNGTTFREKFSLVHYKAQKYVCVSGFSSE